MVVDKYILIRNKKVLIEDIPKNSNKKIRVECDLCHEIRFVFANQFFKRKTDLCRKCYLLSRIELIEVGSIFNRWKVKEDLLNGSVLCECKCGTERIVEKSSLICGRSKSCGCITKERNKSRKIIIPIDTRFHRLVVIGESEKSGKSTCKCDCGTIKDCDNGNLFNGNSKSCGCYQKEIASDRFKELSKNQKGKNHPNWKGGISHERELFDTQKETKDWKKTIYIRDNFTCVSCNQIGYELNVHHIKPYSLFPDLRLDLDNGITLCEKCHRDFHKKYGRKNIGLKELNEFLNNYSHYPQR